MGNNRETGSHYEKIAAAFLKEQGYSILQQNYRCHFGEIDIIAREQGYLVFLEVKYRRHNKMGSPVEAVTPYKQQKIQYVARHYLMMKKIPEDTRIRFDVVGILADKICLYKDAF